MPDPETTVVPTTTPATPPEVKPPAEDVAGLKAHNAKLIAAEKAAKKRADEAVAEAAAAKEKLAKLAEAVGVKTDDPAKLEGELQAKREAEQRAQQERAGKIERSVMKGLARAGVALDDEVFDMVVDRALRSPLVTLDDDGNPTGVDTYLTKVLSSIGGKKVDAPAPGQDPTKPGAPRLPRPAHADPAEEFAKIETWRQLVDKGESKRSQYERLYPEKYRLLYARHQRDNRPRITAPVPAATGR